MLLYDTKQNSRSMGANGNLIGDGRDGRDLDVIDSRARIFFCHFIWHHSSTFFLENVFTPIVIFSHSHHKIHTGEEQIFVPVDFCIHEFKMSKNFLLCISRKPTICRLFFLFFTHKRFVLQRYNVDIVHFLFKS